MHTENKAWKTVEKAGERRWDKSMEKAVDIVHSLESQNKETSFKHLAEPKRTLTEHSFEKKVEKS